jgi:hypothetical protein
MDAADLFQYVTCLLDPPIRDEELHAEFNKTNPKQKLPQANTCSMTLQIPIGNSSLEEFKQSFQEAIAHGRVGTGRY